ncbi:hypothetical protein V6N13_145084 [Hibiscus sabdariffa]|uniref:YDG domain-containing protein n=1 Tax=Hibiscus sabdariffa TaxID=183260 RepID=A0ABR2FMT1_9ROSI
MVSRVESVPLSKLRNPKRDSAFSKSWNDFRKDIIKLLLLYRRLRYKLANKSRESPPQARKLLPLYRILRCKLAKKYWKSPPQAGKKSHPKSLPQAEKTYYYYRSDLYDEVYHRLICSSLKSVIFRIGEPIGHVEGIKVGDKFRSMGELVAVGLHTSHDKRIVTRFRWGYCVAAVSIIDSIQYDDVEKRVLSFEFTNTIGRRGREDNCALQNSMRIRNYIRVIRKVKGTDNVKKLDYKFVYAGLYRATECWYEIDAESGVKVIKFKLDMMDDDKQYYSDWLRTRKP